MAMQKRMFIKEGVNIKEFAKTAKACKEFTPDRQKEMYLWVVALKLEKLIAPGIKRRRIRKKHIKKVIQEYREDLTCSMLDMMELKWVDIPENVTPEDERRSFEAFQKIVEEA